MNLLNQPSHIIFLLGLIVYVWIRRNFIDRTKGEKKVVSRMDTLEKALLLLMALATLAFPIVYLFTPLFGFADWRIPLFAQGIGSALMVASLWLFWRSHNDLGKNWSPSLELRENHELISDGVYRFIRHPMYASIWLWGLAQGLMLHNWLTGWSFALAFTPMYFLRVPREEELMSELFDDEYREYMGKTGRLIPRFRSRGMTA